MEKGMDYFVFLHRGMKTWKAENKRTLNNYKSTN